MIRRWPYGLNALVVVAALMAAAETRPSRLDSRDGEWCGTSAGTIERQRNLANWVAARERKSIRSFAESAGRFEHDMFILQADESITPFDNPADLQGSTIRLTRISPSEFRVQRTSLEYDTRPMSEIPLSEDGIWARRTLSFDFPFYDRTYDAVNVSRGKGLFFATPPSTYFEQLDPSAALFQRIPVIAPLLESPENPSAQIVAFVRETPGVSITFTWRSQTSGPRVQDLQATLFRNGDINLSYRTLSERSWGAVLVTSGSEPLYTSGGALLAESGDGAGDVQDGIRDELRPMLDIRSIDVRRVADSDLLAVDVVTGGDFRADALAADTIFFTLRFGDSEREYQVNGFTFEIDASLIPRTNGPVRNVPMMTVEGNRARILLHEDSLALASRRLGVRASSAGPADGSYWGDTAVVPVFDLGSFHRTISLDLSGFDAPANLAGPILETFTVPTLNLGGVRDRLQSLWGLTEEDYDQVAVYQTFDTDIVFFAAGFSTVGNAGADGIGGRSSSSRPHEAAFLHLNRVDSRDGRSAMHLRTHEFGHRWLYDARIVEDGVATDSLTYGHHPRKGVHLPAAFSVVTSRDSSAMGGGYFTKTGASGYRTAQEPTYYGYSWHELYLMGLASEAEVSEPWFYLTAPGLDQPYYPQQGYTYDVIKRTDVSFAQLREAMGPRNPAYPDARRAFREAVVIVQRASDPLSEAELIDLETRLVKGFRQHFSDITGSRGSIMTVTPAQRPGRRRAVRH
jgi:hypothetical protein